MGELKRHRVTKVVFDFDTGMYAGADVLSIYYEFACNHPRPQPFGESIEFAPEMPRWTGRLARASPVLAATGAAAGIGAVFCHRAGRLLVSRRTPRRESGIRPRARS